MTRLSKKRKRKWIIVNLKGRIEKPKKAQENPAKKTVTHLMSGGLDIELNTKAPEVHNTLLKNSLPLAAKESQRPDESHSMGREYRRPRLRILQ